MSTSINTNSPSDNTNGYKKQDPEEIQIPVPWGHMSGKWWGPKGVQPMLALHGWQDNAGSFNELAASLSPNISLLAVDMPGHGYSSHLPNGQFYYVFWDGVLTIRRIVKHYKWDKVKLLGHSLGGSISFLYAAAYPDEVEFFICLDISSPSVRDVTLAAATTGSNIDKFLTYESLEAEHVPCYEYEEMIDIVEEAYKGSLTRESAKILMQRGMRPAFEKNRYYFTRDPRLKVALLGTVPLDLVLVYAVRIKCPYLNIRAVPGMKFELPDTYHTVLEKIKINAKRFEYHEVQGTHHVHLNNPERIVPIIEKFIKT